MFSVYLLIYFRCGIFFEDLDYFYKLTPLKLLRSSCSSFAINNDLWGQNLFLTCIRSYDLGQVRSYDPSKCF